MSAATTQTTAVGRFKGHGKTWLWVGLVVVALALPWVFFNYQTGRHSGFVLTMLSQAGMMILFALSYNMLMGQAGLLSFGHAVFFGLGGFSTIHFLRAAGNGTLPVPMELMPLLGGLSSLGFGMVFGAMVSKQRATAFAMITMGIGELVGASAIMFHSFFGGEGGVNADRMIERSLFGVNYASPVQVYYLIVAWTVIGVVGMLFLTRTPLGAMANACRDNFERAQFMGYDPRRVRFFQFALAGGFAGIGGALHAITYEIVTFDAVGAGLSANAVLMAYIGGSGTFYGPILGAVLITLMQSGVSLMSNSWLIYVGVMFIGIVAFAPGGLAGMIEIHGPIARAGRLTRLIVPYIRLFFPAFAVLIGFIGLVELMSFLTIGAAQGKTLELFGNKIDVKAALPWLVSLGCLVPGGLWLWFESRAFGRVWDRLTEDLKERDR
ncbi:MAG: branched-chain amino acid ABC transporter permease [Acetobacteraceae bacterium]|nr:branched-chain amino acid ABC transporter permease [Acetobacteraceae bacterium]